LDALTEGLGLLQPTGLRTDDVRVTADPQLTLTDRAILDLELGSVDVLERLGVPVVVTRVPPGTDQQVIVYANPAAVRLLGYGLDELLGKRADFWLSRERRSSNPRAVESALRSGRSVTVVADARCRDGTQRELRIEMVPHQGSWGLWIVSTALWVADEPGAADAARRRLKRPLEVSVGDLALDVSSRRVRYGPREVELAPSECAVLATLMDRAGRVVERAVLYEELWGFDLSARSRAVDVYIGSLRRKLREVGAGELIQTVRGVGYLLSG
jgi:PAS domain S-box-containing protein